MKSQALRRFAFALLAVTVATAVSQTAPADTIVNVPFKFMVASHEMQPGRYIINELAGDLRLFSDQNLAVLAPAHPVRSKGPDGAGKLVFHRYGDSYFLSQVWTAGNHTGQQLYPSKAEKEIAFSKSRLELAELKIEP